MEFIIKTEKKEVCIDLTKKLNEILYKSDITNGLMNVYLPHATGGIIINENADPNVCNDFLSALNKIIPQGIWKHDKIDNNGAAHIKAAILGPSETIPIKNKQLQLGTWQTCMLIELDGPRERKIVITLIKE